MLARASDGKLLLYRGNGAGGWVTGRREQIGIGWQPFTALTSGGDFSGDGNADILARASDGSLLLYRGNGAGGFIAPYPKIGSGWGPPRSSRSLASPTRRHRHRRRPRLRPCRSATAA